MPWTGSGRLVRWVSELPRSRGLGCKAVAVRGLSAGFTAQVLAVSWHAAVANPVVLCFVCAQAAPLACHAVLPCAC